MAVTRGAQTIPVPGTATQAIGSVASTGTGLDGTEVPYATLLDARAGRDGREVNPDTAVARSELTTANKTGTPSVARGSVYTLSGGGSTDDCFNFGIGTVRAIFVQNNTANNMYVYWGVGASASKSANQGDLLVVGGQNALLTLNVFADWIAVYGTAGTTLNNGTAGGLIIFGGI